MNIFRIVNYGRQCFNKLPRGSPVFTAIRVEKLGLQQSSLFSSFCKTNRITEHSELALVPSSPLFVHSRGMKVRGHLKLRCKDCYFARKDGLLYVLCSSYPRHKQRQLTKRAKYTWLLTHCLQTRHRPY